MRTKGYYNGFSPADRSGTLATIRAAIACGLIPEAITCSICQRQAESPLQRHTEDYRRPLDAVPICRGCHVRVHARFRHPARWQAYISTLDPDGWFQRLSVDPASLTRPYDETYPSRSDASAAPIRTSAIEPSEPPVGANVLLVAKQRLGRERDGGGAHSASDLEIRMTITGSALREHREAIGLSQARLSEITGISQHLLSSFELAKTDIDVPTKRHLVAVLNEAATVQDVMARKKRYQSHSYSLRAADPIRAERAKTTIGNAAYLATLSNLSRNEKISFTGVSLFAGIGGFSTGFRAAGCDIKGFVELEAGLSAIYQKNFPSAKQIGANIREVSDDDIRQFSSQAGPIDVLIGGPPCQGFSLSGKRKVDDVRNELFRDYMRFLDILKPKVAVIENVRVLTSMKSKGGTLVKDDILADIRERGYHVEIYEVNAKDYGVPQHRERVIFVAVRGDIKKPPSIPMATHGAQSGLFVPVQPYFCFGDACSDLPFIEAAGESDDPHHKAVSHPDHVIEWLWDVAEGFSAHDNVDERLRPPSGYNTTYKRQIWDEPASTVQTTFGMISGCRNVHPIATRSLTVREAARIQSFPDNYQFHGTLGDIRTGLGNAVPPLLANKIALHLRNSILDLVEVTSF